MTSTAVEVYAPGTLAIRPEQQMFDDYQRAALAAIGVKDATNADLAVFMHYCQKTGLDPFSRQIYLIGRREKVVEYVNGQKREKWVTKQTIQVGIGGFQVIRDRIAMRLGVSVEYEDTVWYDADGNAHGVWLREEHPAACKVVVLKDGKRFPAVVRYSAYVQTNSNGEPNSMWKRMDAEQLEKCAEAKALRKAFPHDLSGVYIPEELREDPAPAAPRRVTVAELTRNQDPQAGDDTRSRSRSAAANGAQDGAAGDCTAREDDHPRAAGAAPTRGAQPSPPAASAPLERLRNRMFALFGEAGWGDREDRLKATSAILGREVTTSEGLPRKDVDIIVARLEAAIDTGDPQMALSDLVMAYQGGETP